MIQWTKALEVGHPSIDTQHRRLVEILNEVMDGMTKPGAATTITHVLKELIDYTKTHFAMEDKLMTGSRYPDATAHRGEHAELIGKIEALEADLKSGKQMVGSKTVMFLRTWLLDHILKTDKKLADFLGKKGDVRAPAVVSA